ncbi:hypothetical protein DRW03_31910 [Corallococcus sp. H22C18031201]|nr:hypothetical protein DRW03_31910 [Corallococcus sp. H22C18031201]
MTVRWMGMAALAAMGLSGCVAGGARPAVQMRFFESPAGGATHERVHEAGILNATLMGAANLRYLRPAELLKAAETGAGQGDPQKLVRAARTLVPGEGVVLLGTVRGEATGGSTATRAIYSLALACARTDLDSPGDLRDCQGYVLRVTRTWPAEVYALQGATVSLISEGGTAHGRIRAHSEPGAFKAELEGEFAASVLELGAGASLATGSGR